MLGNYDIKLYGAQVNAIHLFRLLFPLLALRLSTILQASSRALHGATPRLIIFSASCSHSILMKCLSCFTARFMLFL